MTDRWTVAAQSATFVRSSKASSDDFFATAQDRLRVQASEAQVFLRFRVQPPPGMVVSTAVLLLRTEDNDFTGDADARSVDVDSGPYREMTWNSRPDPVTGSSNRAATVTGQSLRFIVTDDVITGLAEGKHKVAFRITASSETKQWLVGPDGGRGWPRLLLTYETAPRVPADLAPNGVVSKDKGWHQWFGHPNADQVQLQFAAPGAEWNETTGFTTPVHDTGALPRDGDSVNMAEVSPEWAGSADGESLDWSVRQHFPSGWGKWAQPATRTRVVKTPGVLLNPGPVTADSSFPVVWTPPPGQTAWQVIIDIDGDRQDNSKERPGNGDSWTPDIGGDDAGTVYHGRLRTWDAENRVLVPGDPPYAEVEFSTTFTPTPTVAGLSNLDLVQVPGLPAVEAAWTRSSGIPDEVALSIESRRLTRVAGTESGLRLWTFPPNRPIEVAARAIVNNEQSENARTLTLQTEVTAVWLVDPTTERGCVLSGVDGLSVSYGDVTVVHTPIDGAILLRRTLVLRDLEGSITGRIIDAWPGRTMQQQVDDVMWLRQRPRRVLRLIMGDLNIPVACTSLQALFDAQLSTKRQMRHLVSFDCSHAGGY